MPDKRSYHGYEAAIGLEVHAQLSTESKIFCGCRVEYGAPPNSRTCPVCLGLPGALPVLNEKAVDYAIMMILASNGEVNQHSVFARKNYFYPDLPKGYQISQYNQPLGTGGYIEISATNAIKQKKINIKRIHLEEDAGKLLHSGEGVKFSLIDFNRCGVPLIEIVSEPDISFPEEAYVYLQKIKRILQYLGICDGDMEKGQLRCDANVSVRPAGDRKLGVRTEVKNLNSFRFVEKALEFEINRQVELIKSGGEVEQCTMLWDEQKQAVVPMRAKEETSDYRYFPEPDLPELVIDDSRMSRLRSGLPELPDQKYDRFLRQYNISEYEAGILTGSRPLADYYENVLADFNDSKITANWIINELLRVLNEEKIDIDDFGLRPAEISELLRAVQSGKISGKTAKEVFTKMVDSGRSANDIIEQDGLAKIVDRKTIENAVAKVLDRERENLNRYLGGEERLFGYFIGQVVEATDGRADPKLTNEILREKLNGLKG